MPFFLLKLMTCISVLYMYAFTCSSAMPLSDSLKRRIERSLEESTAPLSEPSSSSTQAPRGALRRRIERSSAGASSRNAEDDDLIRVLRTQWAKGHISSVKVHEIAHAAYHPGVSGPDLARMASAGSFGKHPQNILQSFLSFFGLPKGVPKLTWVLLSTAQGNRPHPVMLPHELFGLPSSEFFF